MQVCMCVSMYALFDLHSRIAKSIKILVNCSTKFLVYSH